MAAARKRKGTVGVIGLGIMGGAFARNLAAAGYRVVGYDISATARRASQAHRRRDRRQRRRPCRQGAGHPHQPAQAAGAGRDRARHRRGQAAAQGDRGDEHLHHRRQGKGRARAAPGRPRHARLPGQRHRLAGEKPRPRLLRQRRRPHHQAAQADVCGLRPPRLRRRHVRQWQPHEIRGQPAGRHQQRRHRRSHGAGHEGRPRSADDLRSDPCRRRQFARVRIARADDGQGQIRRRHHEDRRVGQGHARDRRLCAQDWRADADVRRLEADLPSRR